MNAKGRRGKRNTRKMTGRRKKKDHRERSERKVNRREGARKGTKQHYREGKNKELEKETVGDFCAVLIAVCVWDAVCCFLLPYAAYSAAL